MQTAASAEAIARLFELDAAPVIGVNGRTIRFLNAAARALFGAVPPGTPIRRLLPAHAALHQASAFLATAQLRGTTHTVTVSSVPGLRLFRLEPMRTDVPFPDILAPDDLFSAELGLSSTFFSAYAATADDPAVRHYAARLEHTSDQLRRWVRNTTLLQELQRGARIASQQPTDCAALAAALSETLEPMLSRREVRLSCTLPGSPCAVRVSPEVLECILLNLLSNAVRACRDGGAVHINLMHETRMAHLTVTDSGPGFAEGVLTALFRDYRERTLHRADRSAAGYGLPVCLAAADAAGGAMLIENTRGGAAVHAFLPLAVSGRATLRAPVKPQLDAHTCRIGLSDALTDEDYLPDPSA
ncbi:MAG: HAMP domain-containing histidine kinase [Oscillospiraceae bacterium]|nr:HAMP domain-containing histidine kinase [Oscillospiraceae bacterium]